MTVTAEELTRMTIEITNGAIEPPSDFDAEHREASTKLRNEIAEITSSGGVVDLPAESV